MKISHEDQKHRDLFDFHCHVDQSPFYSKIEEYIIQWEKNYVKTVVAVTIDKKSIKRMKKISHKWANFIPAIGWHPWKVKTTLSPEDKELYFKYAKNAKFIGEIGLDYHFIKNSRLYEFQEEVFSFMLTLAEQNNLPCSVHSKGAEKEVLFILKNHGIDPGKIILHWYNGPLSLIKSFLELGSSFSLTPAIAYSKHKKVAELVPLDRLLTESDGPVKYNGIRGDPTLMRKVIEELSIIKKKEINEVFLQIKENSSRFLPMG